MLKRMTLLSKRKDMSIGEFQDHWAGGHAQLALSLPGVCKYTQNRCQEVLLTYPEAGAFSADGIVELFFVDAKTMKAAQASDTGASKIPDDELLFLKGWSLNIVETSDPHDHAGLKIMVPIALSGKIAANAAKGTLRDAAISSFASQVALNTVTSSHSRPRLWSEPVTPDVIMVVWFGSQEQARAAFARGSDLHCAITSLARQASAYICDPLAIR
ncbi:MULTISPECIES: EthD domain-containing protein [unclassified Rhizobium]|uniref:EthD domain-containing protein n=1 Tax=unclassified Rhizobium TaxID=2613769 RepID=UPI00161D5B67|nr:MULTISPECIES: EthD domain-containing protein [unclassified Rhizobium]MBB3386213.1 hypothetical protein [Rhizobium sp. BK098]MBB3571189.1 hypothetical protein [Rhizobium sp. BK491]MBB3617917.1 hypothetical protein [Rhizobium sp. BK609]MBB3683630.1 hypothetical protein [Rhizobium sp. BK612]